MKKLLFLLASVMAFHGKIWAAVDEKVQPKKGYKRPSNRPAPPTRDIPEPGVRGSVEILESTAPKSALLSLDQEEALRKEGSITTPEEAKKILDKEARKTVNWGSNNLDMTSEEDQKRIKEKYREQKALDEVAKSKNSTIKLDKAGDPSVEYKSIKRNIADYETNKRLGRYTPGRQAQIEAEHKNLKRDIKLYNQTAKKRRALEKEQQQLEKSLKRRQAALEEWNKLSDDDKKEEKRQAASLGLDDPEQEAKAKVDSAEKSLKSVRTKLNNELQRAKDLEVRINKSTVTLFKYKAPIKLEEKPVVNKKKVTKKASIFDVIKNKVMPTKKVVTPEKEVKSVHETRRSVSRSSVKRLSKKHSD